MRRLKNLLLVLTSLSLASCNENVECINHIDSDHNGKCDVCSEVVPVNHVDSNLDGKCDICGSSYEESHIDANHDGVCDICSCSMEIKHVDSNSDCVCDVCEKKLTHVDGNDDNYCDICNSYIYGGITLDSYIITNEWGPALKDYVGYVLGYEYSDFVPQMPSENGYECYLEDIPYSDGSGSQLACVINCYTADLENAYDNYETILLGNGFYLGSSSSYGYKLMTAVCDLIVQYDVVEVQGFQFFELIIYKAETRLKNWPAEQISTLLGAEIPVYECESYEFYYYIDEISYSPVAIVYDHNTGLDGLVNYHQQIIATGDYNLVSNTADGYQYLSKDGKIKLSIYPVSDEYNRDSIYITIENYWPYFYISMMLGEDIPCLNMESMEYMFQDIDGDDGTTEYLTIFFDGVTENSFNSYCQQFIQAGWELDELNSNQASKIFKKTIDEVEKEVQVVYSESYGSICVAIKYNGG